MSWLRARLPWLAPAMVAAVGLAFVTYAMWALTFAIFGRDQGIFQYVAWALRTGDRAYRDIHEINGPLPHAWHMVMQALGGSDEHVFRTIDTVMLAVAYALGGATIPRWVGLEPRRSHLALWSIASITVLGAEYVRFDWWHTSQREGLYSILVFVSLAAQALGHVEKDARRAKRLFFAAGLLTSLTWYGKPPCAIFAVLQLGVLTVDRATLAIPVKKALVAALGGVAIATAAMVAFVLLFSDVGGMLRMFLVVPRLHHTIWNESIVDCYHKYGNAPRLDWLFATTAVFVLVFFLLRLPRRALLALVLPVGGFAVFLGQGKAFPYHLHMAVLGMGVAQLVVLAALVRAAEERDVRWAPLAAVIALGLGYKSADHARHSSYATHPWPAIGATAEARASRAYFEAFPWGDFDAAALRQAARFLDAATRDDERIQTYGMDPYLLFLAKRHSASPVIYSFELNVDPALEGGSGARPSASDKEWLLGYQKQAERELLDRITAAPPAAFVFFDHAPFANAEDGERDFAEHCPRAYAWVEEHYAKTARIGTIRVRLRSDVAARPAGI